MERLFQRYQELFLSRVINLSEKSLDLFFRGRRVVCDNDYLRIQISAHSLDASQIAEMAPLVDLLQVGARNMQNFTLLTALGKAGRPVLLKRGLSATIQEWLMAAEYIASAGNSQIILNLRNELYRLSPLAMQ